MPHPVSRTFPQSCLVPMFVLLTMALSRPFKEDHQALLLFTPLASRRSMMSLALRPQVLSQAPQHLRSSEKQTICEGCFANVSCSVISLHSRPCGVSASDADNVYDGCGNGASSASADPSIVRASESTRCPTGISLSSGLPTRTARICGGE